MTARQDQGQPGMVARIAAAARNVITAMAAVSTDIDSLGSPWPPCECPRCRPKRAAELSEAEQRAQGGQQ